MSHTHTTPPGVGLRPGTQARPRVVTRSVALLASALTALSLGACASTPGAMSYRATAPLTPSQVGVAAPATDPLCGYVVEAGRLTVVSLGAKGTARVLRRDGRFWELYRSARIGRDEAVSWKVGSRRTALDFDVSIVRGKLTRDESGRRVARCEPA